MKKILVLANNDIGLYNFRKEILSGLIVQGYEVHISLPLGERVPDLVQLGCLYHETPVDRRGINPIKDLGLIKNYRKLVKQINPDLILTYTIKPNIYGGIVARFLRKPYLTNITGIGSAFQREGLLKKIMVRMYRVAVKNAAVVFFQNSENLTVFSDNKIKGQQQVLIPGSGVNLTDYFPVLLNSDKQTIDYLFIGRVMKEKGVDEYLYAAEKCHKNNPQLVFHLVGDIEEEAYRDRLATLTKQGVIQYHGFYKNVQPFIQQCDCIVLPSYHEGMSNTLLEGAASGRPLIASNISGCKEAIDDGINGYLVKQANSEDLLNQLQKFARLTGQERQNMGRASRGKIEKEFNREIIVKKYQEIATQLIGGNRND